MRKLKFIILTSLILIINALFAQEFNIDLRNFQQVNETEFTFDAYISKNAGTPFTLYSYQFSFEFDEVILNGMNLSDALLSFDGVSELEGVNRPDYLSLNSVASVFQAVNANRISFGSAQYLQNTVPATYFDDDQEYLIDRFRVQLRNPTTDPLVFEPHNFGDAAPNWRFRPNLQGMIVNRATNVSGNTTITGAGNVAVTRNKPANIYDHGLGERQLAGYWFEGDGNWDNDLLWNNVTVANKNTLPGLNSNAIINGNVIIPNGLDVSLLPDLVKSGNGGEVTVLSGPPAVQYTLTLDQNAGTFGFVSIVGGPYGGQTTGLFSAGETVTINAYSTAFTSVSWTSDPIVTIAPASGSAVSPGLTSTFTMPSSDIDVDAVFGFKSSPGIVDEPAFELTDYGKSLLASLTIVPGASITVDKLFNDNTNGAEAIKVLSDATGTGYLLHNNEGVKATVERYLSQWLYHYVSSPIVDAPFSMFQTEPVPVDPEYSNFFMWVEDYPEPDGPSWVNLNFPYYPATNTLTVGRGYAVADSENEFTKEFVGEVNVGDIVYNGTYTPKTDGPPYWNNRGYNLVGNPYPAALDADAFIDANDQTTYNIHGLYFWDEAPNYEGNRNDYAVYTEAGGTGTVSSTLGSGNVPTGYIAPGQGFMAQVISDPMNANADVDIVFNNSMRVTDETYFYKKSSDKDRIWLNLTGPEGDFNQILVAFMEGAEEGFDRTDAQKIRGNNKLAFYSILQDADFSIQGFPVLEATDTYEIPLGVFAGFSGQYTFDVQEIENFAPDTDITFEDRLAGQIINLRTTTQYTAHIADEGDIRDRFFLHINGPTSVPVIDSKLTKVYAVNNQIYIRHTGSSEILDVEVINTLGQTVISTPVNATETTITVPGRNLVYIVKVRTSEGIESHKLLIR
jgi:hypothetical protein